MGGKAHWKLSFLNPRQASTYGTGIQIKNALDEGAQEIILTLGGSATVDGGTGIISALGGDFFSDEGLCQTFHNHLFHFRQVSLSGIHSRASGAQWRILSDVTNPLTGISGGIKIYGPQKGLRDNDIEWLEQKMHDWASFLTGGQSEALLSQEGMGAAGGAALPLVGLWNAQIENGFEWISRQTGLEQLIRESDVVITGEGQLDRQTSMGKGPGKVAAECARHHKNVIGVCGRLRDQVAGFSKIYALESFNVSFEDLMNRPEIYLQQLGHKIALDLPLPTGI